MTTTLVAGTIYWTTPWNLFEVVQNHFTNAYFESELQLQEIDVDWGEDHERTATSVSIQLENGEQADEPQINSLDGILQMVECPGFADSWK